MLGGFVQLGLIYIQTSSESLVNVYDTHKGGRSMYEPPKTMAERVTYQDIRSQEVPVGG